MSAESYCMYFVSSEKPSSPGKPEVVDRDRTFIEMKWEPPRDDGGAPIAGYEVERKEPKTNRWIKLNKNLITVSNIAVTYFYPP